MTSEERQAVLQAREEAHTAYQVAYEQFDCENIVTAIAIVSVIIIT